MQGRYGQSGQGVRLNADVHIRGQLDGPGTLSLCCGGLAASIKVARAAAGAVRRLVCPTPSRRWASSTMAARPTLLRMSTR